MTGLHQRVYTIVGLLVSVALLSVPANAAGVTRVQQSDGSVQVYQNVAMSLSGQTLLLRSRDRKGELEVSSDACSAMGAVQRCLPYSTVLRQHGQAHTIALERGTVFFNLSGDPQTLRHSSRRLGPHEVLVLLHTMRGTIVSVEGTLDTVK
jgi:hypothetical protein